MWSGDFALTHTWMLQPAVHLGCVMQPAVPRYTPVQHATAQNDMRLNQAQGEMMEPKDAVNTRCVRLLPV